MQSPAQHIWNALHGNPPNGLAALVAASLIVLLAASLLFPRSKHDSREPPYIYPSVPFIGHILGMIRYGASYFSRVNKSTRHAIFTLPMLNSRNYIVADATIASHIQRNSKTLSFYHLIVEVTRRLIAFDKHAAEICMYNMNGEHGPGGLMAVVHEMMNRLLGPGANLDAITAVQVEGMGKMMNELLPPRSPPVAANLYAWQRHIFGVCNMHAIYGPQNIFAVHPELEDEFWDFEEGMLGLVVDVFPSFTAPKAFKARSKVLDGLVEYVRTDRYKSASTLIQERIQTNLSFGMSQAMAGHGELVLMFGILGNAVPSSFWLIAHLFSRPDLLDRVRGELDTALDLGHPSKADSDDTEIAVTIRAKQINIKTCPLLYSCYRETLRDISLLTSPKMVLEDTIVPRADGKGDYLLRKESVVQIAGGIMGQDPAIWGEDAQEFNPERFLRSRSSSTADPLEAVPLPSGVPSAAYRAFGGGTVICPSRHFAQSELMTFAAVLALGFDVTEADGTCLRLPAKDDTRIPLSVMKPVYDPLVSIRRREGWEAVTWEIGL